MGKHPSEGETLAKWQARQYLSSAADIIAANIAATVAAVLAAAVVGVGTGGAADPLDDVKSIFTTLGITITQRDDMINSHNITGMDEFDYIRFDDSGLFIKVWNDPSQVVSTKFGMTTKRKLQGFL